jgi:hypothetical protein
MKRSEIEVGKIYAYSRNTNPTSAYQIDGFIVDSLEFAKDWRGNTIQEVKGRFTDRNGVPKESNATAPLRRLIGDYLLMKHDLEIREKNREIAHLNKRIKSKEIEELIESKHALITERLKVRRWDLRNNYDGKAVLTLEVEHLRNLCWDLERLARYEEQFEKEEAERREKAYLDSLSDEATQTEAVA